MNTLPSSKKRLVWLFLILFPINALAQGLTDIQLHALKWTEVGPDGSIEGPEIDIRPVTIKNVVPEYSGHYSALSATVVV